MYHGEVIQETAVKTKQAWTWSVDGTRRSIRTDTKVFTISGLLSEYLT